MLQDLIHALNLAKHDPQVISYILVGQAVRKSSVARVKPQIGRRDSHLALRVIVRTVLLPAVGDAVTGCDFVVVRVVLFLLPAVTVEAAILKITAVTVVFSLLLRAPKATLLLRCILVLVWLTPVVLPIVRVFALVSHVALDFVIEGAPDRLEVEHVEIRVLLHSMQQIDGELVFAVRKSAQIAKVTAFLCALCTKFGLVLLRMIERFDSIVGLRAERAFRALVGLRKLAHLRRVRAQRAPLIFLVVIEALLLIMTSFASARLRLEESQVEQGNTFLALTAPTTAVVLASSFGRSGGGCRGGRNGRFSVVIIVFVVVRGLH